MSDDQPETEYPEGRMRDSLEVTFYFRVHGCPRCHARDCGIEDAERTYGAFRPPDGSEPRSGARYDFTCPHCQLRRLVVFFDYEPRPVSIDRFEPLVGYKVSDTRHLGGWEHSEILSPCDFVRELIYCAKHAIADPDLVLMPDPERLADDAMWSSLDSRLISSAEKCTRELRKFIPAGGSEVPMTYFKSARDRELHEKCPVFFQLAGIEGGERMWDRFGDAIQAEAERRAQAAGPSARAAGEARAAQLLAEARSKIFGAKLPRTVKVLEPARLQAHTQWLQGQGGAQLHWDGAVVPGGSLTTLDLSQAILAKCDFDRVDFSYTRFVGAQLTDLHAREARFGYASLAGSTMTGCDVTGSDLSFAELGDATITDTNFSNTNLERTTWYRAKVVRCSFAGASLHDAAFDHAELIDCDFRAADFSEHARDVLGTAFEATFVRCDFRDSVWLDRSLFRARFIDCKFAGASGPPWLNETVFENCDPSPLEVWGIPAFRPRPRHLDWILRREEVDAVVAHLDANAIAYRRTAPERFTTDEPHGQPVEATVRQALAAYRRSLPPAVLAARVLDDAIDAGVTFDRTIARLVEVGFTRENALEIVVDPSKAQPLR